MVEADTVIIIFGADIIDAERQVKKTEQNEVVS